MKIRVRVAEPDIANGPLHAVFILCACDYGICGASSRGVLMLCALDVDSRIHAAHPMPLWPLLAFPRIQWRVFGR
jgi:hypothetical protein